MMDAVERDQGRTEQGRTEQGRGSFMEDMGCMLSRAGDGDAGEGVAEVRDTHIQTRLLPKKKSDGAKAG